MPDPPPEKPEAIRQRSSIIFSFWTVIVLFGIPIWWITTSIPRAALPIQDMLEWESQKPKYTIETRIIAPDLSCEDARQFVTNVQTVLDERNDFDGFRLQAQLVHFKEPQHVPARDGRNKCHLPEYEAGEGSSALDLELVKGEHFAFDVSGVESPAKITYVSQDLKTSAVNLAEALRTVFADEQAAVAYQLYTRGYSNQAIEEYVQKLPQATIIGVEHHASRALKPSPEYHLTFSLFTAGGTPSSWAIAWATKQYIQPILHSLSTTVNFSITTQVQLYSAFSPSVQPYEAADGQGWILREEDLTAFINTAEWPLSPSIGSGPTINFILYVPAKNQLPLRIEGSNSGAWLVPQWGGITIANPPLVSNTETHGEKITPHLDERMLEEAFEIFRTQLLSLLGVPSESGLPLNLRLRSFQRLSGLSLYIRTASNLSSLARLAQRLSNIPIPHHVLDLVESAHHGLRSYHARGVPNAVRSAYTASEKAFFDKSMVGQVYFPDEHKVAVYLPLLGPIGVPLVVALLRELKQRFGSK